MKEFVTMIAMASLLPQIEAQILFTYDFNGADPGGDAAVPSVPHLSLSPFARVNVSVANQEDVFSSSRWTIGSLIDPGEFVSFTIHPETGYGVQLDRLEWDTSRSASGPASGRVSLFKDGNLLENSADVIVDTTMDTKTFDFADMMACAGETIEFRFQGWNASSTGNMRLDNVSGFGQLVMLPEPKASAAAVACGLVAFAFHRRARKHRA